MSSTYFFNYSRKLQFFQLESLAYQQEIRKFHSILQDEVMELDKLISQLDKQGAVTHTRW